MEPYEGMYRESKILLQIHHKLVAVHHILSNINLSTDEDSYLNTF